VTYRSQYHQLKRLRAWMKDNPIRKEKGPDG
jgi:hypothetical protein